jgi:hypothetical protein
MIIAINAHAEYGVVGTQSQVQDQNKCNELNVLIMIAKSQRMQHPRGQRELRMNNEESALKTYFDLNQNS